MLKKKSLGFTLIEVLLSLATLAAISAIMGPVYASFFNRNNLDISSQKVVSDWRRAQTLARGSEMDSNWGVYVTSTSTTTFKGSSYVTRDMTYDEIESLDSLFSVSGLNELVFSKATGTPINNGILVLTSNNNEIKNVSINSQGTISY